MSNNPPLRIYSSVLQGLGFVADLRSDATGYQRSIRRNGGYWLGNFRLTLPDMDLKQIFYEWLGYHLEERAAGLTWEGLFYEMEMELNGVRRRRSLDMLTNAVRAICIAYMLGDELLTNGDFETSPALSADIWSDWEENAGDGTLANETTNVQAGANAAKATSGASANTYARQDTSSQESRTYYLEFYTRGDGANAGRYRIYDLVGAADIVALTATGVPGAVYAQVAAEFATPAGCNSLRTYFYGPSANGGIAYFDASLLQIEDCLNPGFETTGGGGADVFDTWVETAGNGAIDDEGVLVNSGSHACKLTAGPDVNTYIRQTFSVTPGDDTDVAFYTRGDGANQGRYRIYDATNGAWIVALKNTGVAGAVYTEVSENFTVPDDCTSIYIDLMCSVVNGGIAYFDDVTFRSGNLLDNDGFEMLAAGDFDTWEEHDGDGAIDDEGVLVNGGSHAAKLTAGATANTWIQQDASVSELETVVLTFYTRGDGANAGRYRVYDIDNDTDIIATTSTGITAASYAQVSTSFLAPSGCSSVRLYLYCPSANGGIAYFDDVSLKQYGQQVVELAWTTQSQSVGRYGRKEEVLAMDGYPQATAEARRDSFLSENAWPWARPVSIDQPQQNHLDVTLAGYAFTSNWRFVTAASSELSTVSAWLTSILGTDCEFLTAGNIQENTLEVVQALSIDQRAWDTILELTELGDDSGNLWRLHVGGGRLVHYHQQDMDPLYYFRSGRLYDTAAGRQDTDKWTLRPGVVRDQALARRGAEMGSPFSSAGDELVDEVVVGADMDRPQLRTLLFSETEALTRRQELRRDLLEEGR